MNLHNLGIGKKLGLSFAIIIALLIALATLAFVRVNELSEDIRLTNEDRYPKTVLVQLVKDQLNEQARSMRNVLLMTEPEDVRKEQGHIEDTSGRITATLSQLEQLVTSAKGKEELKALEDTRAKYLSVRGRFVELSKGGQLDQAKTLLLQELRPIQLVYMEKLDELLAFQGQLMEASSKESADSARQTRYMIVLLALGATALAAVLATLTTRAITRPLREAVNIARRVADGDLTTEIHVHSTDESGQMLAALKDMNTALIRIVGEVRTGTDTMATVSRQIASGNLDLSGRTEQQASSLEETASSMEELTSTVKHNADNARQANQLAVSASDVAVKGGAVVAQVVQTMGQINESSRHIVDIISVIDGIAFQTNILALNAAVEAARAGEQGRGFAVVATEVRNLAQRSAAAAKEIKQLIDDSVGKVESGARLVDEAGATMQVIVDSIRNVADIMGEITAASAEQTAGIEQINQAIVEMDNVTQQNAALVEESAAAAGMMEEQSGRLVEVVGIFRTGQQHQRSVPVAAPPKPRTTLPAARAALAKPGRALVTSRTTGKAGAPDADWEEF